MGVLVLKFVLEYFPIKLILKENYQTLKLKHIILTEDIRKLQMRLHS